MRSNNGMEPMGATAVSAAMTRLASLTAVNLRYPRIRPDSHTHTSHTRARAYSRASAFDMDMVVNAKMRYLQSTA